MGAQAADDGVAATPNVPAERAASPMDGIAQPSERKNFPPWTFHGAVEEVTPGQDDDGKRRSGRLSRGNGQDESE